MGRRRCEMAPKVNPDLILMDVRMPRMTGYEACRVMKANPDLKDIPIVFLSAKGQESEIQQGWMPARRNICSNPLPPIS